ncbi:MAG: hypothetical protein IGR80_12075 [Synechococcales cyanobacterium K44_A2020_017]|nr:hypothetical protein [Synechococcales cyanobacterium K44_A2020_017]
MAESYRDSATPDHSPNIPLGLRSLRVQNTPTLPYLPESRWAIAPLGEAAG